MQLQELKPLLATLILPPAGPLLGMLIGWAYWGRWRRAGRLMVAMGLVSLWLLSCNGVAVELARWVLPTVRPLAPALARQLKADKVQAIVVLGGGMQRSTPEYGSPQLTADSLVRLRYGAWLATQSGLPLAFSGGIGWGNAGTSTPAEATGAVQAAREWGVTVRWAEGQSRDTAENALNMAQLLLPEHITRIALVTHATHMPRAQGEFLRAGFQVVSAPVGLVNLAHRDTLEWLPSVGGLSQSQTVLREWLALHADPHLARWRSW